MKSAKDMSNDVSRLEQDPASVNILENLTGLKEKKGHSFLMLTPSEDSLTATHSYLGSTFGVSIVVWGAVTTPRSGQILPELF